MHAGSGVCIMAEENNKYHRRLNKLLQERINRKKEFEEVQRRKEEVAS